MSAKELRGKAAGDLQSELIKLRREQFSLRMQHATGELDNTARLSTARRDLARALTVARQRGVDPTVTIETEADDG